MPIEEVISQDTANRPAFWKLPLTVFVLFAFVAPLFYLGNIVAHGDMEQYSLTVAILLAGGAFGWVIGIFISPLPKEGEQFQAYAKAVAAGVSGYALAKIDPVLSELIKPPGAIPVQSAFRFLGFMVAFIVAMLGAFGWRRYT
jgi:hypothetical protein